jgi:uroporphyrinogen decarboxylase
MDDIAKYEPPDPMKSPVFGYARKLVKRFKGKRAIAVVGEAAFAPPQYMRAGLANLMMDYILQPELAKKLAQISVDYHIELYRKLIKEEGVEIVWIGDDYAGKNGTFMSPAHFEEFILPGIKTIVKEVKGAGAFCLQHTDGDIWKIMDMLIEAGYDALGPLEPAYMNLEKVIKYKNKAIGAIGNIDVDLLSRGSVEEVEQTTRELLQSVKGLGKHILSSGNTISSSVNGKNYMAMLEVAKEFTNE